MNIRTVTGIAKKTLHDFSEHKVVQLSAALAYNAIFALAPFLLVIIGVAGLVLGEDAVRRQVEDALKGMLGAQSVGIIDSMMAARHHGQSIIATVLGTIALLLGAAGLFGQLQSALNTIWGVKPKPGRGIKGMLRDRFLSLAMVFGICFLLLISMILSTLLASGSAALGRALSLPDWIGVVVDLLFSLGVLTVLFAAMFKFLPDVKIPWRNVWTGGALTALLFTLGKWGLSLYLGRASTSSAYGAAGSFVVIIMWIYYASVIVFLGAELTQVITKSSGVKVRPTDNAVPVTASPAQAGALAQPTPAMPARAPEREIVVKERVVVEHRMGPLRAVAAIFSIVAIVRWLRAGA